MDAGTMKLKEIESALFEETPSAEFLAACEGDDRAGVQKLVKKYRRERAERDRIETLYAYEYAARDEGAIEADRIADAASRAYGEGLLTEADMNNFIVEKS